MTKRVLMTTGLICLALHGAATAAVVTYVDRAAFLQDAGTVEVFDFETEPTPGPSVQLSPALAAASATSPAGPYVLPCVRDWVDGWPGWALRGAAVGQPVRFSMSAPAQGVGFDLVDLGLWGDGSPSERAILRVEYADGAAEYFTRIASAGGESFWGIAADQGIDSVTLYASRDMSVDASVAAATGNVWVDNVVVAAVPEPGMALVFVLAGLVALTRSGR